MINIDTSHINMEYLNKIQYVHMQAARFRIHQAFEWAATVEGSDWWEDQFDWDMEMVTPVSVATAEHILATLFAMAKVWCDNLPAPDSADALLAKKPSPLYGHSDLHDLFI